MAGGAPAARVATAFTGGCVLQDGEAWDSPRARAQAWPHATVALHNGVEARSSATWGERAARARPLLERYREIYQKYEPADAKYLSNHRGHLMFLRPEEQEVCTADLIRTMTFTGTRPELRERIRELRTAGYNHFAISIRRASRDARGVGGRVRGRLVAAPTCPPARPAARSRRWCRARPRTSPG